MVAAMNEIRALQKFQLSLIFRVDGSPPFVHFRPDGWVIVWV
jgi:hypothetical protein